MEAERPRLNHDASRSSWVASILVFVTKISAGAPITSIVFALALCVASGWYTQKYLTMHTDRADLISSEAAYQKNWLAFAAEFPDVKDDMVVVVEGPSREEIIDVIEQLGPLLDREPQHFRHVLYHMDWSRLHAKGLQFLSDDDLKSLIQAAEMFQQSSGQPSRQSASFPQEVDEVVAGWKNSGRLPKAHRAVLEDQTIIIAERLMSVMSGEQHSHVTQTAAESGELVEADSVLPLMKKLAALKDAHDASPIHYLMNDRGTMGFVQVQPVVPKNEIRGPIEAVNRLRAITKDVAREHPAAMIGLTGIPVLECDEMISSEKSMTIASILSFVGVFALLLVGYRSWKYSILAMVILIIGTTWSFAGATIAVGHLNILSTAFAAMLFGLGIDFAIVWLSHYMGLREQGRPLQESIIETSRSMGPGIVTASLTAAAAFFVARLTDFTGVAELGVITGWGILLCTAATFMVLPATLVLWDKHPSFRRSATPPVTQWTGLGLHPIFSLFLFFVLFAGLAWHGAKVRYDVNLLNMQAPGLDSVRIQQRIADQSDRPLLYSVCLAEGQEQARVLRRKLEALPTVGRVEELASRLPVNTPERAQILVSLQQVGTLARNMSAQQATVRTAELEPTANAIDPGRLGKSLDSLRHYGAQSPNPSVAAAADQIDGFLDRLAETPLSQQMAWLAQLSGEAAGAEALLPLFANADFSMATLDDVPQELASRYVGSQGHWLLQVYPKFEIWDEAPLRQFVNDLRSIDPQVTGTPVQNLEASLQIRDSYFKSAGYALIAVLILLMWDFRSLHETLLGIFPAIAGLSITFGVLGLLNENLNPANLIVLPLILGIGVDGGVHILHDYRSQRGPYRLSRSTVRAIMLTSTTSMAGFAALMVADHRGLYSLGLVLTVGCAGCLLTALGPVPALLTLIRGNPQIIPDAAVSAPPDFASVTAV